MFYVMPVSEKYITTIIVNVIITYTFGLHAKMVYVNISPIHCKDVELLLLLTVFLIIR